MTLNETKVDKVFIELMNEYRKTEAGKGLLEQCNKNVVIFADKMLGIRLYSWQIDFLTRICRAIDNDYWTKEFVALTSRQIGKSLSVAVLSLWVSVFNKYPGTVHNNSVVGIISASDVQAKKLLYEMKKLIRAGDLYMRDNYTNDKGESLFGDKFFTKLLDENEPNNTTTITFKPYNVKVHGELLLKGSKSGSVIKSYPPTSAVLGETFTIVIEDEAGKTDRMDDMFHYDYVYPTGNSTNAVRIYLSTPWVPSGFFYRLADPNDDYLDHPADRLLFTIDAIREEAPDYFNTVTKTVDQMNKDGKTDEVQRAYYCRFIKGEAVYFNPDSVRDCFNKELFALDSYGKECDMGIDFGGQVISRTVITISTIDESGQSIRLYHKIYEVGKDLSLLEDVEELMKRFNVQRIIPDDCPAGDFLIRRMLERGWNIHPMNFRQEKVKKYGAFRAALNRGEISSYSDDELKTEMLALEFSEGTKQSLIQHAPGYTDDLIDSFVMSTYFYIKEGDDFQFHDINDYEDNGVPDYAENTY